MRRLDALTAIYPRLEDKVVVTIMGAVAAELQSIGHRDNFFYLQHAMGLASSMGLGIALTRPERQVVVFDGDGSLLMNLGGLTTLARYRPRNMVHVVFDNESLLSVGGFPTATAAGSDLAAIAAAAGVPRTSSVTALDAFTRAFDEALAAGGLASLVAEVATGEPTGPHWTTRTHGERGRDLPDNAGATIPARRFVGPACVFAVTADVERDPDFVLTPDRVEAWERDHGSIPRGAWVLLRTGWSR